MRPGKLPASKKDAMTELLKGIDKDQRERFFLKYLQRWKAWKAEQDERRRKLQRELYARKKQCDGS